MRPEYDFSKGERGKLWRPDVRAEKKRIERWYLETARSMSSLIPQGTINEFEAPDFKIATATGTIGIELTELLLSSDGLIPPVEAESFHKAVTRIAEEFYSRMPGAKPVSVLAHFWNPEHERLDKWKMARQLAEFVSANLPSDNGSILCESMDMLPQGFSLIRVTSPGGPWHSQESCHITLSEIPALLASRIAKKNKFLPDYRAALPNSPIWLLVYSGFSVTRGLPIPAGIEEQTFSFDFDKVLFFAQLDNRAVEIRRAK